MEAFIDLANIKLLDRFLIIGIIIFIIGIIFFFKLIIRSITISIQRILHPLPWYSEKLLRKYIYSLLFLIMVCVGLIWIYSAIELQKYQPIDGVSIAGKVEIKKEGGLGYRAIFTSSYEGFPEQNIVKQIKTDQWALGGAFISFPSWLSYIGLNTCHKPLGFASKNVSQLYKPSYDYIEQFSIKPDPVWNYINKIQKLMDIKIADVKLTAFTEVKNMNYEIHATNNGYVITRIGKKKGE